ncbi:RNA polymerase sigma factor [Butyrivibrio sp. INlla21]|uniref:RNA polymerase sigma factor n=1 Tax=Butyrivibrio sp. INlla21 TaxID=1520811 RepID=UPI001FA8C454|nr:RNA polymerase sigma factor [Butyrivibrio sp. INlla21]
MGKIDSKEKLIELMAKYKNLVFSLCIKMTGDYFAAEDITQEAFISAYEHLSDFDGKNEKAWLCRIASNKCVDYLKAAERRTAPTEDAQMPVKDGTREGPEEEVSKRDVINRVEEKCNDLPNGYANIANMYFIKGLKAAEISEKLGIPLKTTRTKIYRAREMLRKNIRKEDLLA